MRKSHFAIVGSVGLTATIAAFVVGHGVGVASERARAAKDKDKLTNVVTRKFQHVGSLIKTFVVGAAMGGCAVTVLFLSARGGGRRRPRRVVIA